MPAYLIHLLTVRGRHFGFIRPSDLRDSMFVMSVESRTAGGISRQVNHLLDLIPILVSIAVRQGSQLV